MELCRRADGREDHDVLQYKINTSSIARCRAPGVPPAILLGLKGIGKSTAFKILTSEEKKDFLVGGFAPGAERFRSLPHVQPELFRERFYVLFLITILAIFDENVDVSKKKTKEESALSVLRAKLLPIASSIKTNAGRLKGLNIAGFGATFDLGSDEHSGLDGFDRANAEKKITSFKDKKLFVRIFIDDPEQALPVGDQGNDALIGLLLAANEINVNLSGVAGITVLLKTHVFQKIADNEELSNIFQTQRDFLCWTDTELLKAIEQRLSFAKCAFEDVFADSRETLTKSVITSLRNGPRDLFVWIALAGERAGAGKISIKNFGETKRAAGEFSIRQITSAYSGVLRSVPQILKLIFRDDKEMRMDALVAHVVSLRTNNEQFIELTRNSPLDYSIDYVRFLLDAGTMRVEYQGRVIGPYEREYFEKLEHLSDVKVALHPLLAAAVY